MQRLILIRHAESEHQTQDLTGGWTDTPLSQHGLREARLLAERCKRQLSHEPSLLLFSSDLMRAAETARHVATALALEVRLEPGLRELNNGVAANLTRVEARRLEQPLTEPTLDWVPYPGAESWRMMAERVAACMERIERASASTAIVVTHGNSGVAAIHWWLRLDEQCRQRVSFELDNASWSEFAINAWQERTIVRLNDACHLQQNASSSLEALHDPM